jgi:pilus assembly protein Flp/PilA
MQGFLYRTRARTRAKTVEYDGELRELDMKRRLIKLIPNMRGATAVEYGLIVALIVIVVLSGVSAVGGANGGVWGNMTDKVGNAMPIS